MFNVSNIKVICAITLSKTAKNSLQKEQHKTEANILEMISIILLYKQYGKSITVHKTCSGKGFWGSIDHVSDVDALETCFWGLVLDVI